MAFTTKPKGIHANFCVDCPCGGELTISHGRPDPHDCREQTPVTLAQIRAALNNRT